MPNFLRPLASPCIFQLYFGPTQASYYWSYTTYTDDPDYVRPRESKWEWPACHRWCSLPLTWK